MNSTTTSGSNALRFRFALMALGCAAIASAGSARAASAEGWYTPDQAQSGEQYFNNYCAQCHRPDLTGAEGPALIGDAFLKQWTSKPLGNLFSFEHSNMPATNPGSLPDNTMWSITAFILQKNGFPSGSVTLNQQSGATRKLVK